MSTELKSNDSTQNVSISNTSFSGGMDRGYCLQMNQSLDGQINTIQLTKDQVINQISIMVEWLSY